MKMAEYAQSEQSAASLGNVDVYLIGKNCFYNLQGQSPLSNRTKKPLHYNHIFDQLVYVAKC